MADSDFEVVWNGAMVPPWSDSKGGLLPPRRERRDPGFAAHSGNPRDGIGTLNRELRQKGYKRAKPLGITVNPFRKKHRHGDDERKEANHVPDVHDYTLSP